MGHQQRGIDFQRRIGYVQQEDIHLPTTTVREALEFSAQLRQSSGWTSVQKHKYVEHIIGLLEMGPYADAVVGVPGVGLNIEQRKRLSIAVEMVARPDLLLFLDEPTSGLDSQTAWSICTLLRKLADNGHSILVTIHQPSSKLFHVFDRLLLLDKTGSMLYFGDLGRKSSTMISYFERGGASKCRYDQNPAEWVLDITKSSPKITSDEGTVSGFWCDYWKSSPERKQVLQQVADIKQQQPSFAVARAGRDELQGQYATSFSRQFYMVARRVFQAYWRDPVYVYSKLGLCVSVVRPTPRRYILWLNRSRLCSTDCHF